MTDEVKENPFKWEYQKEDDFDDAIPLSLWPNLDNYLKYYIQRIINYQANLIKGLEIEEIDDKFLNPSLPKVLEDVSIGKTLKNINEIRKSLAATNSNKLLSILNDFFEGLQKKEFRFDIDTELSRRIIQLGSFFSGITVSSEERFEQGKEILENLNKIRELNNLPTINFNNIFIDMRNQKITELKERLEHIFGY